MKEWGGNKDFEYVHEKYWPELVEICEKRVETWMENWRKLGAKAGISEWDYKTIDSTSSDSTKNLQDEQPSTVVPLTAALQAPLAETLPNELAKAEPANLQEVEKTPESTKKDNGASVAHETLPSESHGADHSVSFSTGAWAIAGGVVSDNSAEIQKV